MLKPDGLVVFSKRACPTCTLIEPVMQQVAKAVPAFQVVSQDDPKFPSRVADLVDDRELDHSWLNNIEFTPTLIRFEGGREAERVVGWDRDGWRRLTGIRDLGEGLPAFQPGVRLALSRARGGRAAGSEAQGRHAASRARSSTPKPTTRSSLPTRAAGPTACRSRRPPTSACSRC